jgi:hypothetical protein
MESKKLAGDDPLKPDPLKSEAGQPSWSHMSEEEFNHLIKARMLLYGFNRSTFRGSGSFESHPNE